MEALSALCNGLIRPEPHRHASLVCLSNYLHGDHRYATGSGKDSTGPAPPGPLINGFTLGSHLTEPSGTLGKQR